MTLTITQPMRKCGRRWATQEQAAHSKLALAGEHFPVACVYGCGGFHLERIQVPSVPVRAAPKDTGPSAKVRAIVLERDSYRCLRCGKPCGPGIAPYSIQHRVARGVGGDSSLPNLVVLCGTATTGCHGEVESRHDRHDLAAGWRLESWQNPRTEGVLYVSEHGSGVLMYLDDKGGISPDAPAGAVA